MMLAVEQRDWLVGGAVIERDGQLLLVHNLRRSGRTDWSTPGGVIDAGETLLQGLTREVEEETGLRVTAWQGPTYEVHTHAPGLGWTLRVEVHRAVSWDGELAVGEDPDGIVTDAEFVSLAALPHRLDGNQRWVSEPLLSWLDERWEVARTFRYRIDGTRESFEVVRE